METASSPPALDGIRVLDFAHYVAGPVSSRLLVDLGADVLKVESRKRPDRPWNAIPAEGLGRTQAFLMVHRGKKSISLDLKTREGRDLALRLASVSDIVVENFSAGVMSRLGLDYEVMRAQNPRLVYVSMSGYGHDGPRSHWTCMNSILQAHSGLMMATGNEDDPPVSITNSLMDYMGGVHGAFAVLEGLNQRTVSGEGCYVDLSQFECSVTMFGARLLAGMVNGSVPERLGNRSTWAVPQGSYRCAGDDQWCVISVESDEQWRALGAACGSPSWATDRRFVDLLGRLDHQDEIDAELQSWTNLRSAEEIVRRLEAEGVPAERVRNASEVYDAAPESKVFSFHPLGAKPLILSRPPFAFIPPRASTFEPLAKLGEHTSQSLRDLLGLTEEELADFEQAEALV